MKKCLALALAFVLLTSCMKRIISIAPVDAEQVKGARSVTVTTVDGKEITVYKPSLDAIRLAGKTSDGKPVTIDRTDIKSAKAKFVRNNILLMLAYGGILAIELYLMQKEKTAPPRPPVGSSCPFFYSWDGSRFVFEAEPYGGAIARALARTEWIPLEHLRAMNGTFRLMMTNELSETEHIDEVKLVVADHSADVRILPDASGRLHTVRSPLPPLTALDGRGRNVLPRLAERDGSFLETPAEFRPSEQGDFRDTLTLEFAKPANTRSAKIIADAWTTVRGSGAAEEFLDYLGTGRDAFFREVNARGPAYMKLMSWYGREELYLLKIEAETPEGWKPRTVVYGGGPYVAKEKAYPIDISDIPGDRLRLRMRPPAGFWRFDSFAVDYSDDLPIRVHEVAAAAARSGDAMDVSMELAASDGVFHMMPAAGDAIELVFPAPAAGNGSRRTVILKAAGYYEIHPAGLGIPRPEIVERILGEPDYALRLAWDRWLGRPGLKLNAR